MSGWTGWISEVGRGMPLGTLLGPVILWTALAVTVLGLLHLLRSIHPAVQEKARTALLLALPLGIVLVLLGEAGLVSVPRRPVPILSEWVIGPAVTTVVAPATDVAVAADEESPEGKSLPPGFWPGLAVLIGGLASLLVALKSARDIVALGRLKRTLRFVDDPELELAARPGIDQASRSKRLRFAVAPGDIVPMALGVFRPVVVVPASLLADRRGLEIALAHELTHVRRRDSYFQALEGLTTIIFALHPLVHLLRAEISRFREMACDAEVLAREGCRPRDYAATLLRLAEFGVAPQVRGIGMFGAFTQLKRRIVAMSMRKHDAIELAAARKAGRLAGVSLLVLTTAIVACSDVASDPTTADAGLTRGEVRFQYETFLAALADAEANYNGRLLVYFYGDDGVVSENVERHLFGNAEFADFLNKTFACHAMKVDSPEAIEVMQDYNVTSRTPMPLLMVVGDGGRAVLFTTLKEVDSAKAGSDKMSQVLESIGLGRRLAGRAPLGTGVNQILGFTFRDADFFSNLLTLRFGTSLFRRSRS